MLPILPLLPAKYKWFNILNSDNYRLNDQPFQTASSLAAVATGYQPTFAISGPDVWDPTANAMQTSLTATGQATANAYTEGPTVAMNLANTGVTPSQYVVWLRTGIDDPGALVPGSTAAGTTWTAPAGSEGVYSITAAIQCSAGVAAAMTGQNYAITVKQNGYPVCQNTRVATGCDTPLLERATAGTIIYIKPGEVLTAFVGAGHTLAPGLLITNVVLTLTKLSGPVTGVTG